MSLDLRSSGLSFVTGAFGLLCLFVLGAALVLAQPGWIAAAVGLLALLYLGHTVIKDAANPTELGLVSVGLLLVGELAQWSIDGKLAGRYEAGIHLSRATGIAVLALLGLGTVALSQVAAGLPIPGGVGAIAVAMAASVALLGLVSAIALRRSGAATDFAEPATPGRRDAA